MYIVLEHLYSEASDFKPYFYSLSWIIAGIFCNSSLISYRLWKWHLQPFQGATCGLSPRIVARKRECGLQQKTSLYYRYEKKNMKMTHSSTLTGEKEQNRFPRPIFLLLFSHIFIFWLVQVFVFEHCGRGMGMEEQERGEKC